MDLGGDWRAAVADDELRRRYIEPDFDDSGWAPIVVPSHWRTQVPFAGTDGPLLYRRRFNLDPPEGDRRVWLELDGVFYQSDLYLDGAYLGDTEGYFFPHHFEITEQAHAAPDHDLALEVAGSRPSDLTAKRAVTGVFDHGDMIDPAWNAAGIWRPVRITESGPVRIIHFRCLCRDATAERATIAIRTVLEVDRPTRVDVVTRLTGPDGAVIAKAEPRDLAAGENRVEWELTVDEPALWWPRSLGTQPLYDVDVEVREASGAVSDRRAVRTGLRSIELHDWIATVNGTRLFLKGTHLAPTRAALADATAAELRGDVEMVVDAGLDLARVHAHVTRPELYDAADEVGLLLWQDLPLKWGYARAVLGQARRQARELVDLLGHHPSIVIWCGHDEPVRVEEAPSAEIDGDRRRDLRRRRILGEQLPTWNKTRLDHAVRRVLEKMDDSRPVIPHSGVPPHLPLLDGTDTHLFCGWPTGEIADLARTLALLPRLARFVGAFGAPAAGPRGPVGTEPVASPSYQAQLIGRQIEALRRLKYRPTGGFAQYFLADSGPRDGYSIVDHERRPKPAHAALVAACRPVIVVADPLPAAVRRGDPLAIDVHVVSDRREPLEGATVTARLSWPGDQEQRRWRGDIDADACVRVGTLQVVVPDQPGPLRLELELHLATEVIRNAYDSHIVS